MNSEYVFQVSMEVFDYVFRECCSMEAQMLKSHEYKTKWYLIGDVGDYQLQIVGWRDAN